MTFFLRVLRALGGQNLRGLPAVVAVPFVATAALLAQSQEQTPIFRSAIEALQLDVYVTDAAGNPATGSLKWTANTTGATVVGSACPPAWLMVAV